MININGIGLFCIALLVLLIFVLNDKYILVPLFFTCLMPLGQEVVVIGMHFSFLRIVILLCLIRVMLRREYDNISANFNNFDKLIIIWVLVNSIIYIYRNGNIESVNNRMGFMFNTIGLYIIFRCHINSIGEIYFSSKILSYLTVFILLFMLIEYYFGVNLFSYLGNVPEHSWIREGKVRSQGPFYHAILAGTYGAIIFPILLANYIVHKNNLLLVGSIFSVAIVIFSHSGSPAGSFIFCVIGLSFWVFRDNIRLVGYSILLVIISLHILMKSPIWYLMAKFSNITGGTGWHRSYLIDQFFKYYDEWVFIGTNSTVHWMPYRLDRNPNMIDITNQFIEQGIHGGIITLILFVYIYIKSFKIIGNALAKEIDLMNKFIIWGIGVSLFTIVISFMSVTFFDQIIIILYFILASLSMLYNIYKYNVEQDEGV